MPPRFDPHELYPKYVPGETVRVGHVVYRGRIVSLETYQLLGLTQEFNLQNNVGSSNTSRVKLPTFSGKDTDNLGSWLATVESRLDLNEIPLNHWVKETANALEGLAADWFNQWVKSGDEHTWENFTNKFKTWYRGKHSALVIARI